MTKLVIIGSGGHAKSSIEVIKRAKKFKIVGLVDDKYPKNENNYKLLGADKDLVKLRKKYKHAFIGVGQLETPKKE